MSHEARRPSTPTAPSPDVLVVGAGAIGLGIAWRLAQGGARVRIFDPAGPGTEASRAAAGILGAVSEAHGPGPLADLLRASGERHVAWARELSRSTGLDVGHHRDGVLRVATTRGEMRRLSAETAWAGRSLATPLTSPRVRRLEPSLGPTLGGVLFPRDGRIDPPRFVEALHGACMRAGVTLKTQRVRSIAQHGGRATGVVLEDGSRARAGTVVLAAGSWTSLVGGTGLSESAIVPARGQMIELSTSKPVTRVVVGADCYVVPRDDGRCLVGSTTEFVGHVRAVTARAVRDLLAAAIHLVPSLADACVGRTWSSFRPFTRDALPILGETGVHGLWVAAGHYRNGILLAPITAESIAALVLGKKPRVRLDPFRSDRPELGAPLPGV